MNCFLPPVLLHLHTKAYRNQALTGIVDQSLPNKLPENSWKQLGKTTLKDEVCILFIEGTDFPGKKIMSSDSRF